MRKRFMTVLLATAAASAALLQIRAQGKPVETYTLPNGLAVTLLVDHSLPQVTINTWFSVGSKDEAPGRSGFAHLFEHLMFMGTERVPGNRFDTIMEGGGGANNASTNTDRTNYYSYGPSSLLPTLLWLDADRMDGLGKAMTQEKLDLQRKVVLNERRQNYENSPYGMSEIILDDALYPEGHPYHHTTIGSQEDIEAAKLQDVKDFFATYYVPGNASLVVAGDFDPEAARKVIADTFGAVPARPLPEHRTAPPVALDREVRRMATDKVQFPKLYLVWPSPKAYRDGDAEMDLTALILSDGTSGRLYKRLVQDDKLAQSVDVFQYSKELGSEFHIEVTAAEGADLEAIKHVVLEELDRFKKDGPTPEELKRVKAATESSFLRRTESLAARADMLNAYRHTYGVADSFKRDLARRLSPDAAALKSWTGKVFGEGRVDLRILPEGAKVEEADLDKRPADFPPGKASPPVPVALTLSSGVPLYVVSRPGTGLFAGTLLIDGGDRLIPADKAGLAALTATLLTDGSGKLDAAAFANAVTSLGASIDADSGWHGLRVKVKGLASKLDPTLDLFADAVLRPALSEKDFTREKDLALAAIRARVEQPFSVAQVALKAQLFGRDDPRGRPSEGYAATVSPLSLADVRSALPGLVNPANARFVFVGDFDPAALKAALDKRFAAWKPAGEKAPPLPPPVTSPPPGRLVLVDRPGAPQTVLFMARPVGPSDEHVEALRDTLGTLFGGSFTSRLNQNIREKHGYAYGAGSAIRQDGNQYLLYAYSGVQTAVTGPALSEFKKEFDGLATGNVTEDEMEKARRTVRFDLVTSAETTSGLTAALTSLAANGRPLDSVPLEMKALDGLTLREVNDLARSGLYDFGKLTVVLVGDKEAVLPQLKKAGFPEPILVNAEGQPSKETDGGK